MKRFLREITPEPVWKFLQKAIFHFMVFLYRHTARTKKQLESAKARPRRLRENFFEKFCQGRGLDIGYGGDLLAENCRGWDIEHGDGQTLKGLKDSEFDFVYSSHMLEHVENAETALKNWWRVLKPGGYLILYLPDRELFERKKILPSCWNNTHRRFFLLEKDEPPDTAGVIPLLQRSLSGYEIVQAKVCDEGYRIISPERQSVGEYSIEVVVRKN